MVGDDCSQPPDGVQDGAGPLAGQLGPDARLVPAVRVRPVHVGAARVARDVRPLVTERHRQEVPVRLAELVPVEAAGLTRRPERATG